MFWTLQHDEWAARQQPLLKFIQSSTQPLLYYKPKIWTPKTEALHQQSQQKLKGTLWFHLHENILFCNDEKMEWVSYENPVKGFQFIVEPSLGMIISFIFLSSHTHYDIGNEIDSSGSDLISLTFKNPINVSLCCCCVANKTGVGAEMLETRRRELEEEFQRVEDRAKARVERVRERGNQVVPMNEQDEELEELEAEIEMYAIALGEDKNEDFLNPSMESSGGPLIFPKTDKDETMDTN